MSKAGPPGQLIGRWLEGRFTLLTSAYQLEELRRVLDYEHLKTRINRDQVRDLFANIDALAVLVEDLPTFHLSPDPDDNPILAIAVGGQAQLVVSGDKGHMVALGTVEGIPILSARDALAQVG